MQVRFEGENGTILCPVDVGSIIRSMDRSADRGSGMIIEGEVLLIIATLACGIRP